jgi:integrase
MRAFCFIVFHKHSSYRKKMLVCFGKSANTVFLKYQQFGWLCRKSTNIAFLRYQQLEVVMSKLSDTKCRNAKPKPKVYKMADGGGLNFVVMPSGSKLWRLSYRFNEKQKTLALGKYPDVSLAEARRRQQEARTQVANGIDPAETKKARKTAKKEDATNTFEKIAREWHNNLLETWTSQTAKEILNRLEKDIFPEIGFLPVNSITHKQLIDTLRKIESRGAHEIAKRLKANCSRIFSYAIQLGLTDRNIAADMVDILKPVRKSNFSAINTDELPVFLKALYQNSVRMHRETSVAIKLMMLTLLRTSELIETPWNEINLETGEWVIPWHRMKMGRRAMNPDKTDHHVCLSRQALELLRELHSYNGGGEWVFPNRNDPTRPMSNGAILQALKRMGYRGRMTGHGFRALGMSTIKEKLNYRHEVVDRQLAHKPKSQVDAAYDRAKFLDERKKMMQDYADYLDAVASGSNVIYAKFGS